MTEENNPLTVVREEVRPVHLHARTGNVLTKKRKRNPSKWKCNVRKKKRQSGEEYVIAEEKSMMPEQLKQRRIVANASLDVVQISVRKIEQLFLKNSGE